MTSAHHPVNAGPLELFVCGWDDVQLWRFAPPSRLAGGRTPPLPESIWRWQARAADGLPADYRDLFNTTDDCKPFDGGARLLVTSSGGGACLIDRRDNRVTWHARVPNAHSADLILPTPTFSGPERVVVAASHKDHEPGDRLILYDLATPERELWSHPLPWAHGAVWANGLKQLWALDYTHLYCFKPVDWNTPTPQMQVVDQFALPSPGGHELALTGISAFLEVTAIADAWRVALQIPGFVPHPLFAGRDRRHIKCIAAHPTQPWLAYVQATDLDEWWSERVHLVDLTAVHHGADPAAATHTIHVPGAHIYKVRWNF